MKNVISGGSERTVAFPQADADLPDPAFFNLSLSRIGLAPGSPAARQCG
jgi:hypothetical protein